MANVGIRKQSKQYARGQLLITAALFLVGLLIMRVWFLDEILYPLIVSAAFTLVASGLTAVVWRRVAERSPESLTTFYTATSGFRMLAALFVLLGCYLVVGRSAMTPYVVVLLVFYFASLAHHSVFFARLSNRS